MGESILVDGSFVRSFNDEASDTEEVDDDDDEVVEQPLKVK